MWITVFCDLRFLYTVLGHYEIDCRNCHGALKHGFMYRSVPSEDAQIAVGNSKPHMYSKRPTSIEVTNHKR